MTSVLVVDDAVDAADLLAMFFEASGHRAFVAYDGRQGVEQAKHFVPHVIFLDLDMPVLDGYGAARAIRSTPEADHPFIVALTGRAASEARREAANAGFDFFFQKPADPKALLALVDDLEGRAHEPVEA